MFKDSAFGFLGRLSLAAVRNVQSEAGKQAKERLNMLWKVLPATMRCQNLGLLKELCTVLVPRSRYLGRVL